MGFYLMQGNYAAASIKAMVDNPHDRGAKIEKLFATAGGRAHHVFFAIGECDWVILGEAPDDVTAAAISMAVGASGAVVGLKTTKLMTIADAMSAMGKAKSITYEAPASS